MVCGTVFANSPARSGRIRPANPIMNYLVISSLHESGIDITEHPHALSSHAGIR